MTKKKHEELVEEIADYLQACYAMGQHDYKLGIGYGETPRKWDKDRAEKIITLILSAVRDGELELPDEAGRFIQRRGWKKGIYNWLTDMIGAGATTFIALLKEEEKNADSAGQRD